MMPPNNGIYIIQGEINLVLTAMRRNTRWGSHSHQDHDNDPLLGSFSQLKDVLNNITDLEELDPNVFLGPFLDVIRSEDTTGPVTGLALTSVNKFLSYGLIDPCHESSSAAIENIADAVTHARFVGTDPSSDEVVLLKILHVLRTMLLCPAGVQLTNESVCEIMQSCFRICFEMRLSELLRKSAEHTLMDMVQLLFTRLPQFKEDPKWSANMRKLKMRAGTVDVAKLGKKKRSPKPKPKKSKGNQQPQIPEEPKPEPVSQRPDTLNCDQTISESTTFEEVNRETIESAMNSDVIATTPVCPGESGIIDISKGFEDTSDREDETKLKSDEQQSLVDENDGTSLDIPESTPTDVPDETSGSALDNGETLCPTVNLTVPGDEVLRRAPSDADLSCASADDTESLHSDLGSSHDSDYISSRGVRFTAQNQHYREGGGPLIPYGLPCVRELFRFLTSLMNPLDRHNTDVMIHMGLSLLTVALESGADHISQFNSLLYLVKDEMCKNLFMLLMSERLSLFAASIRVCFLLFESMRSHLKFQLEMYFTKLSDIIVSDSPRISYEMREIALESIVQLWRIPGLVTECYLNYDCDLYCSNTFDDLTKLLSKNAFPVSGLFSTHLLSLDALLTVVDSIEQHCHSRVLNSTKYLNKEDKDINNSDEAVVSEQPVETAMTENECIGPPTTGYCVGQNLLQNGHSANEPPKAKLRESKKGPQIKPNRMKISGRIPNPNEISSIKHKKKIYSQGADQFNMKPAKGIQFLQENGLLSMPLDPGEVISFLKEYPKLDKQQIGEYISNRKNSIILETFVKSFNFCDLRIDEALRQYLETFRLPGEAPVISYLMEHFSDHWHKSNAEPFANVDAAFTLAYAVIMLNVDQHNHNVKKQSTPMTLEEFKRNLKKVNGGQDFDEDMLTEIYNTIRAEEIVMPDEHGGLVKENYLWKVLLKRGSTKEGVFIHAPTGSFDHDLFTLIWGQTVAALSFVFDKSSDETIIQKAVSGFRKCAMISAHYGMSDVFDNLVISLCKFTTLLSSAESPENIPISFGGNFKAQLAARTVFGLAHRHGDILRDGWKNILDCMLQLYRAKLLPKPLTEVEDFIDSTGKISILKEENTQNQRSDSGVLSSLYSYFSISESANQKLPTPEEQEASKQAHSCIRDCHIDHLVQETKFLREDSLQELVKALIVASEGPDVQTNVEGQYDEDAAVFFLELLIKVVLQNRDRVTPIWQPVRDHLYNLMVNTSEHTFLAERVVVGLLRLAIRLLRRDEISLQVLTSLRILLLMKPNVIHKVSRQIAFGLHDLLRTNAANIHSSQDWYTLFTILEVVGAGTNPPPLMQSGSDVNVQECLSDAGAQSDSEVQEPMSSDYNERVYSSDSELYEKSSRHSTQSTEFELRAIPDNGSWLMVNKDDKSQLPKLPPSNQYTIELNERLCHTDTKALLKSSETLSFLVRDAAHVTPHNFESCVHAIRLFVEASLNGGQQKTQTKVQCIKERKNQRSKHRRDNHKMKKSTSSPSRMTEVGVNSDEEVEADGTIAGLQALSIQLLDLMHTLHTRAAAIFNSWAEEDEIRENNEGIDAGTSTLWLKCWCPLLQGIARLCCDVRRQVRSQALTYLQRALLVHDLQTLSAAEWEACFNKVMFPLLTNLLENINPQDPSGMEETRMRASTLLCKVFLQHLSPLLSLSTFTALWLTILEFMDKYMHADSSDLLNEAIPESLKNMLLVMNTAGIFQTLDGTESQLWKLSWDRIDTFLPTLRDEVFKSHEPTTKKIDRNSEVNVNSCPSDTPEIMTQDATTDSPVVQKTLSPDTDDVQLEGITVVKNQDKFSSKTAQLCDREPVTQEPVNRMFMNIQNI